MNYPIITGKVISVEYEKGVWEGYHGVRGGNRKYRSGGYYVNVNGGYATAFKPSKLTVVVDVSGVNYDVFVDFWFKQNYGRLTTARLDALSATCPSYIELEDHDTYYKASESSLIAWLADAKQLCA